MTQDTATLDMQAAAWEEGARWGATEVSGNDRYESGPFLAPSDNPYRACLRCEARPGDNDHCVYDRAPHAWHRCDGINAPDSNCPAEGSPS